jgi:hypothetical protein
MAGAMEAHGEVLGKADNPNIGDESGVLYITVNVFNIAPVREVRVGHGGRSVSNHYWMNSLPFVKQTT